MANPTIIAGTQNSGTIGSVTAVTVSSTGSVTAGNLMVVFLIAGAAVTRPTGLTPPDGTLTTFLATTQTGTGSISSIAVFYKQATATGSFSGSFSWTNTSSQGTWIFTEWTMLSAALVDGAVNTTQNIAGTTTSPATYPGTNNAFDTLICGLVSSAVGADTITIPAGMASVFTQNGTVGGLAIGVASLALTSASTTAVETWTLTVSVSNVGLSFLLMGPPFTNTMMLAMM